MNFLSLRLKGKLNLLQKMFKLVVVLHTFIILISQLFILKLKISYNFLFVCILFLQRFYVFKHIDRFNLQRSFVLETLINFFLLLCWSLNFFITLTSLLILTNSLKNDILRLLFCKSWSNTYTFLNRIHLNNTFQPPLWLLS